MKNKALVLLAALVLLSSTACAEDLLKPIIDVFFSIIKWFVDIISGFFFALFPGLGDWFKADPLAPVARLIPWIRGFYWLIYLAVFLAVMAVLAKLWSMSIHYITNSVAGVILMLILIHVLGVEIRITLLSLIITALFGVPGVIFVVMLHYLGITV